MTIVWGDSPLTWQELVQVARHDAELSLSVSAWQRIAQGRAIVDEIVASGQIAYGINTGLGALCNLEHRGAAGSEVNTGDGAGILLQVPDRLFRSVVEFELPAAGSYAVGLAFLPVDDADAATAEKSIAKLAAEAAPGRVTVATVAAGPTMRIMLYE